MSFFRDLFSKKRKSPARGATDSVAIPPEFADDLRHAEEAEQRYLRTGERTALDAAAAAWGRILDAPTFTAADNPFQLAALNNAGGVFWRRYQAGGRVDDLNRALAGWRRAVAETPAGSPALVCPTWACTCYLRGGNREE